MQLKNILIFSLLITFIFSGCDTKESIDENVVATTKTNTIKTYKLSNMDGSFITVSNNKEDWKFDGFENKVVLVNFFASWCPPCKAEIPHLVKLYKKYKNDFVVLGVSVDQEITKEQMADFIKQYGINYPVTFGTENFYLANGVGGVSSIPSMFMFDKSGKMVRKYVGAVHEEILESDINKFKGN